jgi:hypothetical protein
VDLLPHFLLLYFTLDLNFGKNKIYANKGMNQTIEIESRLKHTEYSDCN